MEPFFIREIEVVLYKIRYCNYILITLYNNEHIEFSEIIYNTNIYLNWKRRDIMRERKAILQVKDLQTSFFTDDGVIPAVDHIDFSVTRRRNTRYRRRIRLWKKCYFLIHYGISTKPTRQNYRWRNTI